MLERRPDRLITLTLAAFLCCLPLQWQATRWSTLDVLQYTSTSIPVPWWATSGSRALDKSFSDRTVTQQVFVARMLLHGAGSLIPLATATAALATGRRKWLTTGIVIYFATSVVLAGFSTIVGVASAIQRSPEGLPDGLIAYILESAASLLAAPTFIAMAIIAYRRIERAPAPAADRREAPEFGLSAIQATSCLIIGIGSLSFLLGWALPRQEFRRFVHPEAITDVLWSGIIAIGAGLILIRLGLKIGRSSAMITSAVLRSIGLTAVAFVGVFGLDFLYEVTEYRSAIKWNFWIRAASTAAPWMGCLLAACVLGWYWAPVIRRRKWVDQADFKRQCRQCGYDLTGNLSGVCPECGAEIGRPDGTITSAMIADAANPY